MGGEDVEMEVGEEEMRDMIVRSFVCCIIPFMYNPLRVSPRLGVHPCPVLSHIPESEIGNGKMRM